MGRYSAVAFCLLLVAFKSPPEQLRIAVNNVNPWTNVKVVNSPENFQFAIVADRTAGPRPGVFEEAVRKLNLLQPEFVISVGDLIRGYTEDREKIQRQWDEIEAFVNALEMPFFYIPGNHDYTNLVMAEEWERRFGRSYYYFRYHDVLFLCLNTEDPPGTHISDAQIEYVKRALAENDDARWTLVFMHKPLWVYDHDTGWAPIEELLKTSPHTVFAGHLHTYTKHRKNRQNYFVLATTGGGSNLKGPLYGRFDHVVWVTMTDEGPRVANLMLEGIWDENIRTAEVAAIVDPLIRNKVISVQPVFTEESDFRNARCRVRLTNPESRPLTVNGTFKPASNLTVEPAKLSMTLQPNSVEFVTIQIYAEEPIPVEKFVPVTTVWKVGVKLDDGRPFEVETRGLMSVEKRFDWIPRRFPVVVDGDLGEWQMLPLNCLEPRQIGLNAKAWQGPEDLSFRFGVEYDDENLYIAVDVTDDQVVLSSPVALPGRDSIEVRLDAWFDSKGFQGKGERDHLIALQPTKNGQGSVLVSRKYLPERTQAACLLTEKGYGTEIAIPRSYLNGIQDGEMLEFRLNIAVNDQDEAGGPVAKIWWQPDWDVQNIPGSGTFRKK